MSETPRVAVTLTQCWHRVPGGTASAALGVVRALQAGGAVDLVGVGPAGELRRPRSWVPSALPPRRSTLRSPWPDCRCRSRCSSQLGGRGGDVRASSTHDGPGRRGACLHRADAGAPRQAARRHGARPGVPRTTPTTSRRTASRSSGARSSRRTPRGRRGPVGRHGRRVRGRGCRPRPPPRGAARHGRVARRPGRRRAGPARHGLARPYVLWVGTLEPRKNLRVVLRATPAPHARPTSTSCSSDRAAGGTTTWPATTPGPPRLLSRVDLRPGYTGGRVFCFPSLREGFGLPVLEAMAAGVPVVTSAGTSCAEVAGDAALLVDPPTRMRWARRSAGCSTTTSCRSDCARSDVHMCRPLDVGRLRPTDRRGVPRGPGMTRERRR